jgi:hypothetical protein
LKYADNYGIIFIIININTRKNKAKEQYNILIYITFFLIIQKHSFIGFDNIMYTLFLHKVIFYIEYCFVQKQIYICTEIIINNIAHVSKLGQRMNALHFLNRIVRHLFHILFLIISSKEYNYTYK